MIICLCNAIPQEEVKDFLSQNPTLKNSQVIIKLKIGSSCNACLTDINQTLNKIREGKPLLNESEYMYDEDY